MPQISNTTVHDVVVVGSGAGGGTVTNVLANMGISVLLLEAGPMIGISDFKEHMWPHNVPHRGAADSRSLATRFVESQLGHTTWKLPLTSLPPDFGCRAKLALRTRQL